MPVRKAGAACKVQGKLSVIWTAAKIKFWSFPWAVLVKTEEARMGGSVYRYFFLISPSPGAAPCSTMSLIKPHVLLLQ